MSNNYILKAFIILFLIGSKSIVFGQTEFQKTLGKEKSIALDQLVKLFDDEILQHTKDGYETNTVLKDFVQLAAVCAPYYNYNFIKVDSSRAHNILKLIESSALREDIWLFDSVKYNELQTIDFYHRIQDSLRNTQRFSKEMDLISVTDSYPEILEDSLETEERATFDEARKISRYSQIVQALYTCCPKNEIIKDYCEIKIYADNVIPSILAYSILDSANDFDLNDYHVKVILATEFYYHFLYYSVFNKTAPNNL